MWQQGAGRVNAPDAVFGLTAGLANSGLDIQADINGDQHFEGFSYYDTQTNQFRLRREFSTWEGGYGAWAGGYGAWAGGYGAWAGGYGAWAGTYGESTFAEKFVTWREGDGSWTGSLPWSGRWINFDG